jgi:hypothetical protein
VGIPSYILTGTVPSDADAGSCPADCLTRDPLGLLPKPSRGSLRCWSFAPKRSSQEPFRPAKTPHRPCSSSKSDGEPSLSGTFSPIVGILPAIAGEALWHGVCRDVLVHHRLRGYVARLSICRARPV